jgi:hypothetical protein
MAMKIDQLANGLSFGMKETYMIPFNPFLAENEAPVRDYLRLLSVPPPPLLPIYCCCWPPSSALNPPRVQTIGADEVQRGDEDTLDGSESDTRHCLGKLAYDNRDDISRALASGTYPSPSSPLLFPSCSGARRLTLCCRRGGPGRIARAGPRARRVETNRCRPARPTAAAVISTTAAVAGKQGRPFEPPMYHHHHHAQLRRGKQDQLQKLRMGLSSI